MITTNERALLRNKITMHFPIDLMAKLVLDGAKSKEILAYMLYFHFSTMNKQEEFFCELPVDQLCKLAGYSRSTIHRANASLIKKGWLYRNTSDVKAVRNSSGGYSQDVSKSFPCIPEKYKKSVLHSNPIRGKHSSHKRTDCLKTELELPSKFCNSDVEVLGFSDLSFKSGGKVECSDNAPPPSSADIQRSASSTQKLPKIKTIGTTRQKNDDANKELKKQALEGEYRIETLNDQTFLPNQNFKVDDLFTTEQFNASGYSETTENSEEKVERIIANTPALNAQFIEFALKRNDPSLLHFIDKTEINVHDLNFIYKNVIEREDELEEIKRKQSVGGDLYAINLADVKVRRLIDKKLKSLFPSYKNINDFEKRKKLVYWLFEKHSKDLSVPTNRQIDLLLQSIKKPAIMEIKLDSMPQGYEVLPDHLINHIVRCREQLELAA